MIICDMDHPVDQACLACENMTLKAEVKRLKDIEQEQLDVLFKAGPITCRNGVLHERIDDCVYCVIDATYLKGLEEGLKMYAWWKDGVEYVGSGMRTLKEAIKKVRE